jgi:hypothetical protein
MPRAASVTLLVCALSLFTGPASSMISPIEQTRNQFASPEQNVRVAHKRDNRHCHNVHVRTYCHKRDRLPMNWPPHSDTPGR